MKPLYTICGPGGHPQLDAVLAAARSLAVTDPGLVAQGSYISNGEACIVLRLEGDATAMVVAQQLYGDRWRITKGQGIHRVLVAISPDPAAAAGAAATVAGPTT